MYARLDLGSENLKRRLSVCLVGSRFRKPKKKVDCMLGSENLRRRLSVC